MLTHRNVVSDVKAVLDRIAPTVDDVFLSFLPLSHTFERTGVTTCRLLRAAAWPMRARWRNWPRT